MRIKDENRLFLLFWEIILVVSTIVICLIVIPTIGSNTLDDSDEVVPDHHIASILLESDSFKILLPVQLDVAAVAIPFHGENGEEWWVRIGIENTDIEQEFLVKNEEEAHWILNMIRRINHPEEEK